MPVSSRARLKTGVMTRDRAELSHVKSVRLVASYASAVACASSMCWFSCASVTKTSWQIGQAGIAAAVPAGDSSSGSVMAVAWPLETGRRAASAGRGLSATGMCGLMGVPGVVGVGVDACWYTLVLTAEDRRRSKLPSAHSGTGWLRTLTAAAAVAASQPSSSSPSA